MIFSPSSFCIIWFLNLFRTQNGKREAIHWASLETPTMPSGTQLWLLCHHPCMWPECPLVSQDGCHSCKYHTVTWLHPKLEGQEKGQKGYSFIREENISQKPPVDSPSWPIGQNWVTRPLHSSDWQSKMEVCWQFSSTYLNFVESLGTRDMAPNQIQGCVSKRKKGDGLQQAAASVCFDALLATHNLPLSLSWFGDSLIIWLLLSTFLIYLTRVGMAVLFSAAPSVPITEPSSG